MKQLLLLVSLTFSYALTAQTWSDDVAEIFYEKCTKCHHTGGVAPFPLMTHAETTPFAIAIYDAINQDEMPPWPPNNDYQSYSHDRSLEPAEKTTVLDWLTSGTPEGTPANTPPPPVYTSGSLLGNGDLEVQMPTYMSKATASGDDYVCFALPSNLPLERVIKAIEIVPGNNEIVHHALIYIDPTNSCVTDTVGGDCGGPSSNNASLVMGYTPGSSPLMLPTASPLKLGMTMPANSQVVMAMHYPEGSYGEFDSTKVIFHFYPPGETGVRQVSTAPILQNWNFALPPDQLTDVTAQYPASGGLPFNYSLLSVFPHMHLLGESMTVYGIKPNNDTLKLIDVPHYDFEWQDFYFYKNIQKADAGTVLHAKSTYNNTSGNLHNPNNPPITVYPGLNTSDEMMLTYMHFMQYLPGDETHNLDSLINLTANTLILEENGPTTFSVYPNPFGNEMNIYTNQVSNGDQVSISVFDSRGAMVNKIASNFIVQGDELHLKWNGNNSTGQPVDPGMYFLSININGVLSHQRVMKR
ncbi:MAG: T9SS type A sorting domain-containing protein [Crocinitomicaceae bacterium]